jgi:hypothetical protein
MQPAASSASSEIDAAFSTFIDYSTIYGFKQFESYDTASIYTPTPTTALPPSTTRLPTLTPTLDPTTPVGKLQANLVYLRSNITSWNAHLDQLLHADPSSEDLGLVS